MIPKAVTEIKTSNLLRGTRSIKKIVRTKVEQVSPETFLCEFYNYDPALARFLSSDPFLSDPTNSQDHNRYSYCLNNPLTYTDPSGYKPLFDPWYGDSPVIWNPGGGSGGLNGSWRPPNDMIFFCSSSSAFVNQYGLNTYNNYSFWYINLPRQINLALNSNETNNIESDVEFYSNSGFTITPVTIGNRVISIASIGPPGNAIISENGGLHLENFCMEVVPYYEYIDQQNTYNPFLADFENANLLLEVIGLGIGHTEYFIKKYAPTNPNLISWDATQFSIQKLSITRNLKMLGGTVLFANTGIDLILSFNGIQSWGETSINFLIGCLSLTKFSTAGLVIGGTYMTLDYFGAFDIPTFNIHNRPSYISVPDATMVRIMPWKPKFIYHN